MNYLICGAPGSGKTTYVKTAKKWDDYVLDLDYLYQALTLNPLGQKPADTFDVMKRVFESIINILSEDKGRNIYIIRCAPTREEREYYKNKYETRNILIHCHSITCQKRRCEGVNDQQRRTLIMNYVGRWFKNYQDGAIDETINGY